ncbi:hypothetical protein MSS93_10010 [Deinococcus radiodurans]|nr:hypothetical protein MSS93_10010 [Deinococcus radiodurans]
MTALSGLLQEASDPGTPAARLAQLAAHSNSAVRRAARKHMSFPPELAQVIDLAERTPQLLTPEQLALLGILGHIQPP